MAKLKPDAITAADLEEFVASESDFGFEMQVLARLRKNGFECEHSATYVDPVTQKIRQFDIRARMEKVSGLVALAVECKNLRRNHPLLLSTVPRFPEEAFHQVIVPDTGQVALVEQRDRERAAYKVDSPVAKDRSQVGRTERGELTSADADTYDRLNQAVNSCAALLDQRGTWIGPLLVRVIVPVLVVPSGVLWQVDYDSEGTILTQPREVERGTIFFDHSCYQGPSSPWPPYRISHMEVYTLSALDQLAERCFGPEGFFN